jgi:hypothetical protein
VRKRIWLGDLTERYYLENIGVGGSIILKWIFKKWYGEARSGLIWPRIRQLAGSCKCGNEPSCSIKYGNLLTSGRPVSFSRRTPLHKVI